MASRTWTCQRVTAGAKCSTVNPRRKQLCDGCGKRRPPTAKPKHLVALELPYEHYVEINGGEECGICGAEQKAGGKRLHRDHDHRTSEARGLLCFRDNSALRPYMTVEWLEAAAAYLRRARHPSQQNDGNAFADDL